MTAKDELLERNAALVVALRKLATRYHAYHGRGLYLTCDDVGCRLAVRAIQRNGDDLYRPHKDPG